MPGQAQNIFDKLITIKDQKSYPANGRIDLMSIRVTNPNSWIIGPEILYSWIKADEAVVKSAQSERVPFRISSEKDYRQKNHHQHLA